MITVSSASREDSSAVPSAATLAMTRRLARELANCAGTRSHPPPPPQTLLCIQYGNSAYIPYYLVVYNIMLSVRIILVLDMQSARMI